MRVELLLVRRDESAPPMAYLQDDVPHIIYVDGHAGEQVFEIRFDAAKLDDAIRSIRGEH